MLLELIPISFILFSSCLSHPMGNVNGRFSSISTDAYEPSSRTPIIPWPREAYHANEFGPGAENRKQEMESGQKQSLAQKSSTQQFSTKQYSGQSSRGQSSQEQQFQERQSQGQFNPHKISNQEGLSESGPQKNKPRHRQRQRKPILEAW